jgi:energy-coupling factor transporter ATP-binding protein EcfA2
MPGPSPLQKKSIVPTPEQVAAFLAKRGRATAEQQGATGNLAPAADEPPRPNVRHAAPIEWLWPGRIARGKLTVITGAPGSGKSTLAVRIAAAVSSGGTWPCGEGSATQGLVVLICPDGDTDVLDPRLRAAGADLDRVRALRIDTESVPTRAFDLGLELKQLENAIASGQDVQLVVVDVLHVASGRTGMREARALFDRLATFARRHNVAVVALAQAADADYLTRKPTRLSGFTLASARMAFAIEADPADEDRRLLLQMKNELGPDPGTLAFRITSQATAPGQSAGTVTFEPHRPGLSPHEFTARQSRSFNSAKAEAIAFLRDLFGTEKRLWVRDIEAQARAFGLLRPNQPISQCRPLRDARIALGLQAVRAGFAKDGAWSWTKPGALAEGQTEAEPEQSRQVVQMQEDPSAGQQPAAEQQAAAAQGLAPADPARPITEADPQPATAVASPPLQPAPTHIREPANEAG